MLCNAQLNKNIWKVGTVQFLSGFADATNQAYIFHYHGQFFNIPSNDVSWTNKWKKSADGTVLVGQEKFWLSSRSLVWTTDFHHLTRFVKHRSDEVSMVFYAQGHGIKKFYWSSANKESRKVKKKRWYYYAFDMAIAFSARSVGFWLAYEVVFK
jgi:hypothetical protein